LGATAKLTLLEAACGSPYSKVEIAIENTGDKAIRGYDVGIIEDYEYKKNVESSQGVVTNYGAVLAVGERRSLNFEGGFTTGLSYGRPTGNYQRSVLWIKRLDYTDGTNWVSKLHRCSPGSNQICSGSSQLCAAP